MSGRMWLMMLAACGGRPGVETRESTDVRVPESAEAEARASCLARHCGGAPDRDACADRACAPRDAGWGLVPLSIRYSEEEGTLFVEARVRYDVGGFGDVAASRTEPVHVGVTAVRTDGTELDLAVQTRFVSGIEEPFLFTADVGEGIESILFGVWDRKIEPCRSERSGCEQFGFLLDGSLATWPERLYETGQRQRILPASVRTQVRGGAPAPLLERADRVVTWAMGVAMRPFQTHLDLLSPVAFGEEVEHVVVTHRHPRDVVVARAVASALEAEGFGAVEVSHRADLDLDFAIYLPKGLSVSDER